MYNNVMTLQNVENTLKSNPNDFTKLINQWNNDGIIYENQCYITMGMITRNSKEIMEIIKQNGGFDYPYHSIAFEVENEGFMYAIYTSKMWTLEQVKQAVKRHFK